MAGVEIRLPLVVHFAKCIPSCISKTMVCALSQVDVIVILKYVASCILSSECHPA